MRNTFLTFKLQKINYAVQLDLFSEYDSSFIVFEVSKIKRFVFIKWANNKYKNRYNSNYMLHIICTTAITEVPRASYSNNSQSVSQSVKSSLIIQFPVSLSHLL